jgi:hypothetical protein
VHPGDSDEDEDERTAIVVDARLNIRGHGNVHSSPPIDPVQYVQRIRRVLADDPTIVFDGTQQQYRITVNLTTTITGDRNVVGPNIGPHAQVLAAYNRNRAAVAQADSANAPSAPPNGQGHVRTVSAPVMQVQDNAGNQANPEQQQRPFPTWYTPTREEWVQHMEQRTVSAPVPSVTDAGSPTSRRILSPTPRRRTATEAELAPPPPVMARPPPITARSTPTFTAGQVRDRVDRVVQEREARLRRSPSLSSIVIGPGSPSRESLRRSRRLQRAAVEREERGQARATPVRAPPVNSEAAIAVNRLRNVGIDHINLWQLEDHQNNGGPGPAQSRPNEESSDAGDRMEE